MRKNLSSKHLFVVHIPTPAAKQSDGRQYDGADEWTDKPIPALDKWPDKEPVNSKTAPIQTIIAKLQMAKDEGKIIFQAIQSTRYESLTLTEDDIDKLRKSMPACPLPRSPRKSLPINHRRTNWTTARPEKNSGAKQTNLLPTAP